MTDCALKSPIQSVQLLLTKWWSFRYSEWCPDRQNSFTWQKQLTQWGISTFHKALLSTTNLPWIGSHPIVPCFKYSKKENLVQSTSWSIRKSNSCQKPLYSGYTPNTCSFVSREHRVIIYIFLFVLFFVCLEIKSLDSHSVQKRVYCPKGLDRLEKGIAKAGFSSPIGQHIRHLFLEEYANGNLTVLFCRAPKAIFLPNQIKNADAFGVSASHKSYSTLWCSSSPSPKQGKDIRKYSFQIKLICQ